VIWFNPAIRSALRGEALREPSAEEPRAAKHGDRGHGIACGILDQVGLNGNKRSR
jgi:hypothetical protein